MRSLLASSLLALPLLAQPELLDRAATLPPELYADVVLRLAEAGKLKVEEPAELLERIFLLANQVKYPVRPRSGAGLPQWTDSISGVIHAAGDHQLDRLSIQVRIAVALKSAKLFREIDPTPPPQTCNDLYVYRPDIYYENLWRFPAYAPDAFRRIARSSQLVPAFRSLRQLPNTEELTVFLAGAMPEIHDSWRSFAPASLVSLMESRARPALLPAWRIWFANHMNGRRCSSSEEVTELRKAIELYNKVTDTPLDPKDFKSSGTEETPEWGDFFSVPASKRILAQYRALRFGGAKETLPEAERRKPDWDARLRDFLNELSEWKHDDKLTSREIFHHRAIIHYGLFAIIPPGPLLRKATTEYVSFLALSPVRTDYATEWLTHVDRLLQSSPYAAEEIRRSGDLALNVLLETEALAPRRR